MSKFCESCTNANTPICKECMFVRNCQGDINIPSEYCAYDLSDADEIGIGDLAALISNRVKNNHPIQLRYVIKYNKLLEERNNGKKKDIHAS